MGKFLDHIADAFTGSRRQSSDRVLSIAQRGVKRPETLTTDEIKSLSASVISQARK